MPQSGIRPSTDVKIKYSRVHKKGKANKLPYAVFKFCDKQKEVIVDYDPKFYDNHYTYTELIALLPDDSPRYICYDFPHRNKDENKSSSVILVSWFPQKTHVKLKFLSGSTSLALVESLGLVKKNYCEGEDITDICEASVCSNAGWKPIPAEDCDQMPDGPIDMRPEEE